MRRGVYHASRRRTVAAAAFRADAVGGDGQTTQSSSWSITVPSSGTGGTVVAGDIALLGLTIAGQTTLTTPSGWTITAGSPDDISTTTRTWFLYKVLTAPDIGASVSLSFGASTRCTSQMNVYSGVTITGMQSAGLVDAATGTTTTNIASLSSVASGSIVHGWTGARSSTAAPAFTPPAGYTQGTNNHSASNYGAGNIGVSAESYYKIAPSAGSYGGESGSETPASQLVHYMVELKAA